MTIPHYDLDVRPILREGGEPFSVIMQAVEGLAPGQGLRLLATFKPVPLFQVLGARGFESSAREIGNGDWEVIFTPANAGPAPEKVENAPENRPGENENWPEPARELDNRGLEPPEPMVLTIEAAEALAPGETVAALLPREPLFLFEELKTRGFSWRGGFEPQGHYRIVIRAGTDQAPAAG